MLFFRTLSPAMLQIMMLVIAATLPGNEGARELIRQFDANLCKILGPFGRENYLDASDQFIESLRD